jgi:hypothetical protein
VGINYPGALPRTLKKEQSRIGESAPFRITIPCPGESRFSDYLTKLLKSTQVILYNNKIKNKQEGDNMDKKLKHLDMIQGVVNRLANDSFMLKGWSVMIVAALLALSAATREKIALMLIAFIPLVVFWILDGYFLWQERLFREIYNHVIKKDEKEIDFVMNPGDFSAGRNTWIRSIFSITLLVFYGSLIITMGGVILYLAVK